MKQLEVKVKRLSETATIPTYATPGAAGCDLYADEYADIYYGETLLVKTGIAIEVPEGYEAQVRSRSGLAMKSGIFVLNSPGTIDSDYRGEIGVVLHNTKTKVFNVDRGDRIAQLVFSEVPQVEFTEVEELTDTQRGTGSFGSTGQ